MIEQSQCMILCKQTHRNKFHEIVNNFSLWGIQTFFICNFNTVILQAKRNDTRWQWAEYKIIIHLPIDVIVNRIMSLQQNVQKNGHINFKSGANVHRQMHYTIGIYNTQPSLFAMARKMFKMQHKLLGPTVFRGKFGQIRRTSLQNSAAHRGKIVLIPRHFVCK